MPLLFLGQKVELEINQFASIISKNGKKTEDQMLH